MWKVSYAAVYGGPEVSTMERKCRNATELRDDRRWHRSPMAIFQTVDYEWMSKKTMITWLYQTSNIVFG